MAYYQQVGRAGRSIPAAVGVLMSGSEDDEIQENFRSTAFPFPWDIGLVLGALCKVKSGLGEGELQRHCNLRPRDIIRVGRLSRDSRHELTKIPQYNVLYVAPFT